MCEVAKDTENLRSWLLHLWLLLPSLTNFSLLKTRQVSMNSLLRIWFPYKCHGLLASWVWENFRVLIFGPSSWLFSWLGFHPIQGFPCLLASNSRSRILKAFLNHKMFPGRTLNSLGVFTMWLSLHRSGDTHSTYIWTCGAWNKRDLIYIF